MRFSREWVFYWHSTVFSKTSVLDCISQLKFIVAHSPNSGSTCMPNNDFTHSIRFDSIRFDSIVKHTWGSYSLVCSIDSGNDSIDSGGMRRREQYSKDILIWWFWHGVFVDSACRLLLRKSFFQVFPRSSPKNEARRVLGASNKESFRAHAQFIDEHIQTKCDTRLMLILIQICTSLMKNR